MYCFYFPFFSLHTRHTIHARGFSTLTLNCPPHHPPFRHLGGTRNPDLPWVPTTQHSCAERRCAPPELSVWLNQVSLTYFPYDSMVSAGGGKGNSCFGSFRRPNRYGRKLTVLNSMQLQGDNPISTSRPKRNGCSTSSFRSRIPQTSASSPARWPSLSSRKQSSPRNTSVWYAPNNSI